MSSFVLWLAFVSSSAALGILALWVWCDGSFGIFVEYGRLYLRLDRSPETELLWSLKNSDMRPRMVLLGFLAFFGGALPLVGLGNELSRGGLTRPVVFLILLSAGLWLAFFATYEKIANAGLTRRIRGMLPTLKNGASILLAGWPQGEGQLPELGEYAVDRGTVYFYRYIRTHTVAPKREQVICAYQLSNGGMSFNLSSSTWTIDVDFCPDDEPFPTKGTPIEFTTVKLDRCWFLRYCRLCEAEDHLDMQGLGSLYGR